MGKPIIRHCRNCKYSKYDYTNDATYCDVKYKGVVFSRLSALLCRFYKTKGGEG